MMNIWHRIAVMFVRDARSMKEASDIERLMIERRHREFEVEIRLIRLRKERELRERH